MSQKKLETNIESILKSVNFIVDNMATKDDVRDIVQEELRDIRRQLEVLEESSKSHSGFSKEIDHVLQRVITIERHLGIKIKV